MVSITHAEADELAQEEIQIPAGGRWMEMDWDCVARAFEAANRKVGWDADIVLTPERQHALIVFSRDRTVDVGHTMGNFHEEVEALIGAEAFMSIWIDYRSKP